MEQIIIKNAIIDSVSIQLDREYFLSVWVGLKFDSYSQSFGGYVLGKADEEYHPNAGNHAGTFIIKCMKCAGVETWKDMVGKTVRVKTGSVWNSRIEGIGHIIKDEWFLPDIEFDDKQFNDE